jgi:hypothetical protein
LKQWLFCLVEFPLRYYASPPINNWRVLMFDFRWHTGLVRWVSFPLVYATVTLPYIAYFVAARRRSDTLTHDNSRNLRLIAIVGVAMLLAVVPSPSVKRLATVSPPAIILVAWLLDRRGKAARRFTVLLASAALTLALAVPLHIQSRWHASLSLPAGRSAFLDPALYEEYQWLLRNTHPGQYFFGLPPLYYAFHLRNPAAIEGYDASEYSRPQQVIALVEAFDKHPVPLLVIRQSSELLRRRNSPTDHLEPFRAYLTSNYQLTNSFATGDDVWQRIDTLISPQQGKQTYRQP